MFLFLKGFQSTKISCVIACFLWRIRVLSILHFHNFTFAKVSLPRVLRWDGGLSRSLLWSFLLMWKCAGRGSQSLDTSSSQTQRLARVTTPIQHSQLSPTEEFRQTDPSLDNEKPNRLKTSLHWFDLPAVLSVWAEHWYSETMSEPRIRWAVQENPRLGDCCGQSIWLPPLSLSSSV